MVRMRPSIRRRISGTGPAVSVGTRADPAGLEIGVGMKHWKYLDVARGIGLLLVIISHSCGLSPYLINYYIPLFFVVSGYLYKPGRSYGEIWRTRRSACWFRILATARCCWCSTGQSDVPGRRREDLHSECCTHATAFLIRRRIRTTYFYLSVANGAM